MTHRAARAALLLALAAAAGSAAEPEPGVRPRSPEAALVERWAGVYDTLEQLIFDQTGATALAFDASLRVRTIVAPVALPWLGATVLYLEEFLQDDPDRPRRLVLLRLMAEPSQPAAVRVRQFTFRDPEHWRRLYADATLLESLSAQDLEQIPGCDLVLAPEGDQFRGGTVGRQCIDTAAAPERYVDYRLLVGGDLYWYRKRLLRLADDQLLQESVGFEWFELHRARLFACRVRWAPSGRADDLAPLTAVELHDEGGHARFTTPDGHAFELELHSRDWPFDPNRDALILVLHELGAAAPLASAWTELTADQISVRLEGLEVHCGPIAPNGDNLRF
jgi:hypothetical protein